MPRHRRRALATALALVTTLLVAGGMGTPAGADGNEAAGAPVGFRSITAGFAHTCALLIDARVTCWGNNSAGQLGLGDTVPRGSAGGQMGSALPKVALGGRATAISVGNHHSCALMEDGTVKCWGDNSTGQLGQGHTQALGDGPNEMGTSLDPVDLGTGRTATAISASGEHTCAVLDDAGLKCWGANFGGELGLGDTTVRGDQPNEMGDDLDPVDLGTGHTATAVASGASHTCALLDDASVKCWGFGPGGRLGTGDELSRGDEPSEMGDDLDPVDLGTGHTATVITAGNAHTCARLEDATVKCWGANLSGQLGLGDTTLGVTSGGSWATTSTPSTSAPATPPPPSPQGPTTPVRCSKTPP